MVEHVVAQALLAAHGAEVRVKQEMEREPVAQSRPEEPSQQEVENHALTNDKQTCLFMHDRAAKFMHAVPTPQKGARFLQHMVTEVTRFIVYTQHRELFIRTDCQLWMESEKHADLLALFCMMKVPH